MQARKIITFFFLILLLLTGILCFRDYGINWDEPVHQWRGHALLDYLLKGKPRLMRSEIQRSYGPFPDVLLAVAERAAGYPQDTRAAYLSRRLILFLIFYAGVVFFFLLAKRLFRSWSLGLTGGLFLVLSPRIFAHAFHNAKDIPLLVAMIIAFYTLARYLENPTWARLALHALACAVATDVRITGILSFCLTGAAFLMLLWESRKSPSGLVRLFGQAVVFSLMFIGLTILFWPTLWHNPVKRFVEVIHFSMNLPWGGKLLYLGKFYRDGELPWHYVPVWMAVSIPLLYIGFFLLGIGQSAADAVRKSGPKDWRIKTRWLILLWFFVPPMLTILFGVHTFDEWRHLFFIYPAFLLIALQGLSAVFRTVVQISPRRSIQRRAMAAVFLAIFAGLFPVARFMLRNHPHENIFFNRLAGRQMAEIAKNFELDYWGISYKQGLEYLLASDPSPAVRLAVENRPGEFNAMILPRLERQRLIYVLPRMINIGSRPEIRDFVDRHAGRYALSVNNRTLIIRAPMTEEEKEALARILKSPEELEALEKAYHESQSLENADYFLTNYRLHPAEYPLPKVHSINVGDASIMGIYRFPRKQ